MQKKRCVVCKASGHSCYLVSCPENRKLTAEQYKSEQLSINIDGFLSVMSWNINGGILDKLPVLEKLCKSFSVIQEHFLTGLNSQLLCPSSNVTVHLSPARRFKAQGRPSGSLAVLANLSIRIV